MATYFGIMPVIFQHLAKIFQYFGMVAVHIVKVTFVNPRG